MSAFQVILGEWLREITTDIERKEKTIQRHKKISTDHKSDTVKNRERCDVTLTYEQSIYQNVSPQGTVGDILQNKTDIMSYCMQSNLDMSGLIQQRIEVYFRPRPIIKGKEQTMYDNMISDFKNSFWSKTDFSNFLKRLPKYKVQGDYVNINTDNMEHLYEEQLQFLWDSLLPPQLQLDKLRNKKIKDDDLWEIIDLLHDNRLKDKLEQVVPENLQPVVDQLLKNRLSMFNGTFDSEIFSALRKEYPLLNVDQESSIYHKVCRVVVTYEN
jgi:hypothetical protein